MDSDVYELTCGQCKDKNTPVCNFCKYGKNKSPKRLNLQKYESEKESEELSIEQQLNIEHPEP